MKQVKIDRLLAHDVVNLITETLEELAFAYGRENWETIAKDPDIKNTLIATRDSLRDDLIASNH